MGRKTVSLPVITEEIYVEFGDNGPLIDDDRNWSQDAVDFACLIGSHLIDRVELSDKLLDIALRQLEQAQPKLAAIAKLKRYTRCDWDDGIEEAWDGDLIRLVDLRAILEKDND